MTTQKTFNSVQEFLNWKKNNPEAIITNTSYDVDNNIQNIYQRYDSETNETGSVKPTVTYTD